MPLRGAQGGLVQRGLCCFRQEDAEEGWWGGLGQCLYTPISCRNQCQQAVLGKFIDDAREF